MKFKKDILEKLITNKKEVVLDKVEVLNQKVIGRRKQSIYFAKVTSTDKKATFSRILVKKGNTLYLNEGSNARSFDLTYLMCQPKDKSDSSAPCNPNVFDIDGQLVWACGDDPKCAAPNASVPCNTFHAVIIP